MEMEVTDRDDEFVRAEHIERKLYRIYLKIYL